MKTVLILVVLAVLAGCGTVSVEKFADGSYKATSRSLFKDIKDQLHLETIRVKTTERVERLLFVLVIAYYVLTLLGAAAQRTRLRRKVCKDKVSLAWMALRLLFSPQFITPQLVDNALFHWSWSLSYQTG